MKLQKKQYIFIISGIFIVAIVSMYQSLFMPAYADMFGAYANISLLNFFISGTAIFTIITMLLCPFLERKIGAKKLFLLGIIMIAAGGIIGIFSYDIMIISVAQSICLAGYGITGTMALAILMAVISDAKRGFFNGIYQVFIAGAGALFAFVGGILTAQSWKTALNTAWWVCAVLAATAFLILIRYLPGEISTIENTDDTEITKHADDKAPLGKLMVIFLAFLLIGTVYQYFNLMVSIYTEENAIGDAVFSGTMQSLGTIGSAIMCFTFGFVYKKVKRRLIVVYMAVITLFTFLLYFMPSVMVTVLAAFIMGAAFGGSITYFYTICPDVAPNHMTMAVALIGIALNLPYMFISYIYTFMASVFGTLTSSLPIFAIIILLETVAALFITGKKNSSLKQ